MSKIYVACAGSGKTTHIVKETLSSNKRALITTFTDNNVEEIKKKFIKAIGVVPSHVEIIPWYSFLIKHIINPFLPRFITRKIIGVNMVSTQSALYTKKCTNNHYIDNDGRIYSDKIAELAFESLSNNRENILSRLKRIFNNVYIDEFQDMAAYDFNVISELNDSQIEMSLYCDPRQHTFSTNMSSKNKKYRNSSVSYAIENFKDIFLDENSLNESYRCCEQTIKYASMIFKEYPVSSSKREYNEEEGIIFLERKQVKKYIDNQKKYTQLRYSRSNKDILFDFEVLNFGESKGLTRDNVILYPTNDMKEALKTMEFLALKDKTRSSLYVALTRSEGRTIIVIDDGTLEQYKISTEFLKKYDKEEE